MPATLSPQLVMSGRDQGLKLKDLANNERRENGPRPWHLFLHLSFHLWISHFSPSGKRVLGHGRAGAVVRDGLMEGHRNLNLEGTLGAIWPSLPP